MRPGFYPGKFCVVWQEDWAGASVFISLSSAGVSSLIANHMYFLRPHIIAVVYHTRNTPQILCSSRPAPIVAQRSLRGLWRSDGVRGRSFNRREVHTATSSTLTTPLFRYHIPKVAIVTIVSVISNMPPHDIGNTQVQDSAPWSCRLQRNVRRVMPILRQVQRSTSRASNESINSL